MRLFIRILPSKQLVHVANHDRSVAYGLNQATLTSFTTQLVRIIRLSVTNEETR
jgi:hypothetical protein